MTSYVNKYFISLYKNVNFEKINNIIVETWIIFKK